LSERRKENRDRLVVLSFVSVLLVLIYGPLSPWFVAADRFLFDLFAGKVRANPADNAVIVSIDASNKSRDEVLAEYGRLLETLKAQGAAAFVLPDPPQMSAQDPLPGWAALLSGETPVFVPTDHRLADVASHSGVLQLRPDSDDVLRSSRLWHLGGSTMSPSLPLAVALASNSLGTDPRMGQSDFAVYHARYEPVTRMSPEQVFDGKISAAAVLGKTVFLDSAPELVGAVAVLPSGQFVTPSEISAQLLAEIEQERTIVSPAWVRAFEWLAPVLLAIIATLFLPDRSRRDIVVIAAIMISVVVLIEALFLLVGRLRLDMGRAAIIFLGASLLSWWLAGAVRKASANAFRRGSDFLAAGRLEPAFAEFRRCEPTETLASAMYKLSLAFEEQAKPERAEAVIQWMKKTQGGHASPENKFSLGGKKGTPQRLGRYVIERRLGRGAMGAVYLARDPRINRAVALKVIPIEKEFEDEELEEARLRFFREAESAGRLTHPNIITVYDCGEDKHLAYIAM
jgi:serine/threonine-protein kinase